MKIQQLGGSLAASLVVLGCYTLQSTRTLDSFSPTWTGSGTYGLSGPKYAAGLAGENIYLYDSSGRRELWSSPLSDQFGGSYVLTSVAQTHSLGHHEHSFVHGNLVGRTDNLDLFYGTEPFPSLMSRVEPWWPQFWDAGSYFAIVEICDMAAAETGEYGHPTDPESHLFLSVRACNDAGSCAGGVVEATFDDSMRSWWIRSNQEGVQATIRKANDNRFSNECMPIAVTSRGDQETQYLVLGDPSWDELSVFDATRLWEGPLDALRTSDSTRNIADVVVEGRRDGSTEYAFLATLWSGSGSTQLEHRAIVNGAFPDGSPHLTETLPDDVRFLATRGLGAETTTSDLFTFGDQVVRRRYEQ